MSTMRRSPRASAIAMCVGAAALALVAVFGLMAQPAAALYEEQAGTFDWYREHLGAPVTNVFWPNPSVLADRSTNVPASRVRGTALVGTRAGVLALVKAKTGAIVWRQVLPDGDAVEVLAFDRSTAVTVSGGGRLVRAWFVGDGSLLWESGTHTSKDVSAPLADGDTNEWRTYDAVVYGKDGARTCWLHRNTVSCVTTETGQPLWKSTVRSGLTAHRLVGGAGDSTKLYVVSSADGTLSSALTVTTLNGKGEVDAEQSVPAFAGAQSVVVTDGFVVFASDSALRVVKASDATVQTADYKNVLSQEQQTDVQAGDAVSLARAAVRDWFTVSTKKNRAMLKVGKSGAASVVQSFPSSAAKSVTLAATQDDAGRDVVIKAVVSAAAAGRVAQLTVEAIEPVSGATTALAKGVDFDNRGGSIAAAFAAAVDGKALHALLVAADDSLSGVSGGSVGFIRDEALGDIRAVEFVELPLAHAFGNAGFPSLAQRIVPQAKLLVRSIQQWVHTANALITTRKFPVADRDVDAFGFRKLVVALTGAGKLYALHTEGGVVQWATVLPECVGANAAEPWRMFAVAPHTVAVVSRSASQGVVHVIDALTGRIVSTARLTYPIADVFVLPFASGEAGAASADADDSGTESPHALLVVDATRERIAHVVPATGAALAAFAGVRDKLHFHVADATAGQVSGYVVSARAAGEKGAFETDTTWTHAFAPEVESIAAVAGRRPEAIHASIRMITSNEDGPKMLYKYLNPHLLAVATVRTAPTSAGPRPVLKKTTDPAVVVYLIDTVSGVLTEKLVHRGATGPVQLAQSEHVVLYHYWNAALHQYEVSVVELYQDRDSSREEDASFSSYTAPAPQVMQQTYSLRTGVKAVAATRTHRGITQKDFLLALTSDQLLSVAKHFVDPRRPYEEPTQAERDDALVPYMPELPADPVFVVSYNRTISRMRAIATTHAQLESTSLVFAYGLDLFYTRVTPSQTFDLLNEDFNYGFLILTVIIVAVPIVITRGMAKRKELANAWK